MKFTKGQFVFYREDANKEYVGIITEIAPSFVHVGWYYRSDGTPGPAYWRGEEEELREVPLDYRPPATIAHLGSNRGIKIFSEEDSLLVRKIKELDYKWELRMKEKGNFFLTSRALPVEAETTSQSTLTGTVTASDARDTVESLIRWRTYASVTTTPAPF